MKKSILFVCLGNICRSPAAEAVFLHKIKIKAIETKYFVDSAGTGGWHEGNKSDSRMINAALKRGIDIKSRARQITIQDLQSFDLILTMDQSNLAYVNALIKEVRSEKIADVQPILKYAKNTKLKDVPDPYYGGDKGFDDVLDLLEDAIEGLLINLNSEA